MVQCQFLKCRRKASFNYPGVDWYKYCENHKTNTMVDVRDKSCAFESCGTFPVFNAPGKKRGKYCAKHRTETMVDVVNK